MKKLSYLIVLVSILGLALTGCTLLSNIGQVPTNEQSGIAYLTKSLSLAGLVGLWHFDEGEGDTAYDSSGTIPPNDGTVYGADYVDSPMGQALSFGGSDYVYVPDSESLDITRATLEAWIKPSMSTQTGCARIVFKGTNSPFKPLYFLAYDGSGTRMRMVVFIGGCGLRKTAISATALTDTEKWYHIAGTYDGEEVKIYIDGFLEGTTSAPGDVDIDTGSEDLGIGRNTEINSYGYKGLIDEVRIWNTALTADQLIRYGFIGLLAPYKEPPKAFKIGSSIPLKWQYTDFAGTVVESSAADPSVEIKPVEFNGAPVEGTPIEVDDPGSSGLRYDHDTKTWHFNWQTKELEDGRYHIWITSGQTLQVNGPFLIELR